MQTLTTTKREEYLITASKLSIAELNELINKCLDEKNFKDAQIYAEIYNRRVK
jgi:hypothetical protein